MLLQLSVTTIVVNAAYRIAQSVGKNPKLCSEESRFKTSYDLCLECLNDNTNDNSRTVQDYVSPQFGPFLEYCDDLGELPTVTPTACEACSVVSTMDFRGRPVVYTLGPQSITETLEVSGIITSATPSPSFTPKLGEPEPESGPDIAKIVGPVVPSVVLVMLLGFLGLRWFKQRQARKASIGPAVNEEEAKEDKPQLHSDCITSLRFELEGSTPMVPHDNGHEKINAEMAANEPAAHEMSTDKKILRKPVGTQNTSGTQLPKDRQDSNSLDE